MEGLSKTEIKIVSDLEFREKYYFTTSDISHLFDNQRQRVNTIFKLRKKGRIIKLNRHKYYLVPIKARTGKWVDDPYIIADEIFDGAGYFVGGWAAAHYWKFTDQIPMQLDIYTVKRKGKTKIMNTRFVFHQTTKKWLEQSVTAHIGTHPFKILNKNQAKQWFKSRR